MNIFFRILVIYIAFFVIQSCLEILIMSALAKFGISYMDVEVRGESFKEVIEGIAGYYSYSKLFYLFLPYLVICTTFTLFSSRGKDMQLKGLAIVNIVVNLIIFIVLWFGFGNSFRFVANPILGLIISGWIIYFFASRIKSPISRIKKNIQAS